MRYLLFPAALVLAACGKPADLAPAGPSPASEAAPEAAADAFRPTSVVYDPVSSTATAFTGALTVTPLEAVPAGDPARLRIESATGLYFETLPIPADKARAAKIDWASVLAFHGLSPAGVEVHEVVRQEALGTAPNGGLCGEQGVYALAVVRTADTAMPGLRIAAFGGNEWPPVGDKALCGTFSYSPHAS